jgi:methylthioribulose-1-phosphate dehydratase/2,3-diketo-5-methylthio-1-phosphopentane phosphatase
MSVALPDVYYLDDPSDGASKHLLATLGVEVVRGLAHLDAAKDAAAAAAKTRRADEFDDARESPWLEEHRCEHPVFLHVTGGCAFVDVRDSADAWVRVVLRDGDGVLLAPAGPGDALVAGSPAAAAAAGASPSRPTYWRVVLPHGSDAVPVPVYPADIDADSRMSTRAHPVPVTAPVSGPPARITAIAPHHGAALEKLLPFPIARFPSSASAEARSLSTPHFSRPGVGPHTRSVVVDLCESFYRLGWVTGTGGSISIRHGDRIFMAPSGVQKERMQPQDMFVLDTEGREIYSPLPVPGRPRLKLSQCAPLFHHAFTLRGAGACIHTHDINAVLVTLLAGATGTEFRITHQEMIKGIMGHGFLDTCVVPIIENTPHECDLADSLGEAMRKYPRSNAVLVRRHGVYVWGSSWEAAKTQAECYHYLFEAAVRMRAIGVDPAEVPVRVEHGIGAGRSYGSGHENAGGHGSARGEAGAHASSSSSTSAAAAAAVGGKRPLEHAADHEAGCGCGSHGAEPKRGSAAVAGASSASSSSAVSDGFHGGAGTSAMAVDSGAASAAAASSHSSTIPALADYSSVLLDVEGCTTSIQFVTETLFPYAAAHVRRWLHDNIATPEGRADAAALVEQSVADVAAGVDGARAVALSAAQAAAGGPALVDALAANVAWQMSLNRKTGCLKQLQGHVWRAGYEGGALKGHVFPDTPPALRAWVEAGKRVYIYSSGSREAQRLLFKHSEAGDLRPLLSGYFDTRTGPKLEAPSYADIALSLGVDAPSKVLFLTDSLAEAVAASKAGMRVVVTDRPGNVPLPADQPFAVAKTLLEVAARRG